LSAHRGFLGCNHFVDSNKYLIEKKDHNIDWNLLC
ncbi:uracil-DNA glycosylase, partial [Francisella tularensis subsp. holarctica]|nr:uracil-DNA glycosylase [Francisella tularensis subsp. holarctica]